MSSHIQKDISFNCLYCFKNLKNHNRYIHVYIDQNRKQIFYIKIMRSNECCDSKGHIHLKKTLPVKHMRWRVLRFLPE